MPGSNNKVQFANGYRLERSAAEEWQIMQKTATDVSCVNNAGNPEGVVPANMGSLCHDMTNGDLYVKKTGTGNTGWLLISTGGAPATDSFAMQTGISPVVPTAAGLVTFNGAVVAAGTNPVRTDGTAANTMALEVQISQALAATDATKIGLCNFDSTSFSVDANGFVQTTGGGFTWNDISGAFSPLKNNGYFITGTATGTLPASPGQGDTIKFFVDHASQLLTIDAPGTQIIRLGSAVTAAGGTAVSSAQGDSVELVYRTSDTCWCAIAGFSGIWTLT